MVGINKYGGHIDLCIIWLADCAFVLVLRLVLKERWRAGGACLRPNHLLSYRLITRASSIKMAAERNKLTKNVYS